MIIWPYAHVFLFSKTSCVYHGYVSNQSIQKPKRKRRSDYGSVVLTSRDLALLKWIGEQYAIRFDHLQVLATRYSVDRPKKVLGYHAVYGLSSRWVKLGLVERKRIFTDYPMWLWLTKKGLETAGLEHPYKVPAISRFAHVHAVNGVRLHVEAKVGDSARWICEREANALRKEAGQTHLIDGLVEYPDENEVVGVEVELTQKRQTRLNSILKELRANYKNVWYFASDEAYNAVESAIKRLPDHDEEETFILYRLSSIMY
jgi:hypothetical protein